MKKIVILMIILAVAALAEEQCYKSAEGDQPKICTEVGFICKLGVDVGPQTNAMFFYLGQDPACTTLFKSNFNTVVVQDYIDENGKKQTLSTPSTATKFFLENDDGLAGPLSMTIAGSFALSAYNNSSPVYVIYRQVSDIEHGGIRVLSISHAK